MAKVKLERRKAEEGDLPSICVCCGKPANVVKRRDFTLEPQSLEPVLRALAFLCGFLVVGGSPRGVPVEVPLCKTHTGHWLWRSIFAVASLCLLIAVALPVMTISLWPGYRQIGDYLVYGVLLLGVAWLIAVAGLEWTVVRAIKITEQSITLTNVSPRFVDALRDYEADSEAWGSVRQLRGGSERAESEDEQFKPDQSSK